MKAIVFLQSLVSDVTDKDLLYDGTPSNKRKCIDMDAADEWHSIVGPLCKVESFDVPLFGEKRTKKVLCFDEEKVKNMTVEPIADEAKGVIRTLTKAWLISDDLFQLLIRVSDYFEIVRVHNQWKEDYVGLRRLKKDDSTPANVVSLIVDDKTVEVDPNIIIPELTPEEFRYRNVILLMKEVQEGYHSFREHSIVNISWDSAQTQKYKIGQDITVSMKDGIVLSVSAVATRHSISKIDGEWLIDGTTKTSDFKFVSVTEDELGVSTYIIRGAYTHILRKVLGFNPQTWQYKYLVKSKRLNSVAGTRRAGKTMLSSYLILRELYCNPLSKKHSMRQRKVLYVAPSESKFKSVLDYIESATQRIKILKVLKYSSEEKRYSLVDETLGRNKKRVTQVVGSCDMISAQGYEAGRGDGSDLVIVDEAALIPRDVYLTLLPIIENENASFFAISTIAWESPKQWFYELLLSFEQGEDREAYAQRVTIDDIDDNIISKDSKERMKNALRDDIQRYFAELYATFPAVSTVFNSSAVFVLDTSRIQRTPNEVIIWYDPAKRTDFWGVIVGEILWNELFLSKEVQLQGDYERQRELLSSLKKEYISKWIRCQIIIDSTVVGDVVADTFWGIIDHRVWYRGKGSGARPEIDKWGSWKVPKRDLVNLMQIMINERMLCASSSLTKLMEEMKNFKQYETASGGMQYEAAIWHDDLVNAAMLTSFYFGYISWRVHNISYNSSGQLRSFRENLIRNDLNKPFSARAVRKKPNKGYHF